MTKIIWIFLGLFVIGNAFFILPFHVSDDNIVTSYFTNYKKDSDLLHTVFSDTGVFHLQLNMPERFNAIYLHKDSTWIASILSPAIRAATTPATP